MSLLMVSAVVWIAACQAAASTIFFEPANHRDCGVDHRETEKRRAKKRVQKEKLGGGVAIGGPHVQATYGRHVRHDRGRAGHGETIDDRHGVRRGKGHGEKHDLKPGKASRKATAKKPPRTTAKKPAKATAKKPPKRGAHVAHDEHPAARAHAAKLKDGRRPSRREVQRRVAEKLRKKRWLHRSSTQQPTGGGNDDGIPPLALAGAPAPPPLPPLEPVPEPGTLLLLASGLLGLAWHHRRRARVEE